MKIPKCPQTITGNHKFEDTSYKICTTIIDVFPNFRTGTPIQGHEECVTLKGDIKCVYCGLIDDRPLTVEKKKL